MASGQGARRPPPAGPCRATGWNRVRAAHHHGATARRLRFDRPDAIEPAAAGRTSTVAPALLASREAGTSRPHQQRSARRSRRACAIGTIALPPRADPIVGRGDLRRPGRAAQPHVARGRRRRQPAGTCAVERLAHPPGGASVRSGRSRPAPSAAIPSGSGAPKATRARAGRRPRDCRQPGRLDRRLPGIARARVAPSGRAPRRREPRTSRQRCRGSDADAGARLGRSGSGSTSASLRHDGRARPAGSARRRGPRRDPRSRCGWPRPATPAVRRPHRPRTTALRPAVAACRHPHRRRRRRRPAPVDGARQRPAVHPRPAVRLPPRPAGPLAGRAAGFAARSRS